MKKQKKTKSVSPLKKEETLKKLGARIRQLRLEKGHDSYEHFAYDNDISRSQFGKYEHGADVRFTTIIKIVNGLDISLEDFFKGM